MIRTAFFFLKNASGRNGVWLAAFLLTAFTATASVRKYRDRELGDSAFLKKDYSQAMLFYSRYLKAAADDRAAGRDAYARLIAACLRASKVEKAETMLAEFEKNFPFAEPVRKALFRADIMLLKLQYREAESLLRKTLQGKVIAGKLYFQLLSGLGFALIQQHKWNEAVQIYDLLEKSAVKTKWEFIGFRQRLYAMIMAGKLRESRTLFPLAEKFRKNPEYFDIRLLALLQMVQEKKFSEMKSAYAGAVAKVPEIANPLLYMIDMIAARHYLATKAYDQAAPFLKDAFTFAPSQLDRKNALHLLINTYVDADMKKAAIAAALKYIEFYRAGPDAIRMKFQCARLMIDSKMFKDALAILTLIKNDVKLKPASRIAAAADAAIVCETLAKYEAAARMLLFVYENGPDNNSRMKGKLLLAKLYYRRCQYRKAANVFLQVSEGNSKWREQALFWAMQSLIQLKDYPAADSIANQLAKSKGRPELTVGAAYFSAVIQNLSGETGKAMVAYLRFFQQNPQSQYAPQALLGAARISFKLRQYKQAANLFISFADKFPKNELAPDALYKGIQAEYFQKNAVGMNRLIDRLVKNYPQSQFAAAALFWRVDCLRGEGRFAAAEQLLLEMHSKYQKNPKIIPQILYDQAATADRQRNSRVALKLLQQIFEHYPTSAIASDALFLAGNIAAGEGEFNKAAAYYRRAAEMRPKSTFATACLGKLADSDLSLYFRSFDAKYLKDATEQYRQVLEQTKTMPALRNQTLYKLGRCYELLDEEKTAIELYNELIYGYENDLKRGRRVKPVWTVKAAYAAIMIYLKKGTPESAASAVRIYQILKSMQLDTGEDFDKFIKNIKTKYRI